MILPLTHDRMTVQRLPWVTIGIIALNCVVFLATWPQAERDSARMDQVLQEIQLYLANHPAVLQQDENCESCPETADLKALIARFHEVQSEHIFSRYGYVPAHHRTLGLFGSLFLHAGWMHLLGNMYLLWLCGCSIEDLWGRPLYAAFYLLGGAGAALFHASFQPGSTAPLVGASGAIAALMGVFCVRCWNTRIRFFYWLFITMMGTFTAPAWIMLALWFTWELFSAFVFADSSSVAFWAHIGGFGLGVGFAFLMRLTRLEETFIAPALDRKTNLVNKHPKLATAIEHFDRGDYPKAVSELSIAVREDRDDPDLYQLLAQCYHALGQPANAARWLRQKLTLHLKRREQDLVASTYEEMVATLPDVALGERELSAVAGALTASGQEAEAANLYEKVLETGREPLLRLKAGIALADLFHRDGKTEQALTLLDRLRPLAETVPECLSLLEQKRSTFGASVQNWGQAF